jgi:hypothetical protein
MGATVLKNALPLEGFLAFAPVIDRPDEVTDRRRKSGVSAHALASSHDTQVTRRRPIALGIAGLPQSVTPPRIPARWTTPGSPYAQASRIAFGASHLIAAVEPRGAASTSGAASGSSR